LEVNINYMPLYVLEVIFATNPPGLGLNFEKPPLTVLLLLQPPEDLQVAEVELEDAGVEPVLEALLLI
jgi:hypothetical protein